MDIDLEVINCVNDIIAVIEKKEKKRLYHKEYNKKYREENAEKERLRNKKYREKNKEKMKLYKKEYREKNKEKIKLNDKEYREKNKEKIKLYQKEYNKTPVGLKTHRISLWKKRGVIVEDWDGLYYRYLSTAWCDACKVKLTYDKYNTPTTKMLDHCHITGQFRNILCHCCNSKRRQNNF